MRYTCEILIHKPRAELIELFSNTENLSKWQPGFLSLTHLDGKPGEEGARSELVYESRKGDLVLTECILKKNFPEQFHMTYKSRGVNNRVENWFTEKEPGVTLWQTVNSFRFRGMMRLMAPFMKQAFIHNTMLHMDRFKLFAENPDIR
ncbi:MAG: SRPBCC family protein [Bacteroidales bacterium]|nr:SRPBCC family protein [Bacteroidales bacterium]